MNREGVPGKSPEEMYIQQKVRVLLMLRKMGSNLTASEEEFLRTYAGVVNSQLSQLPQHSIDQGRQAERRGKLHCMTRCSLDI
uniref:Beta-catenin-interacting protein 1 n=1 Tax=Amazona collaria TaxID=241587 RepID=A0A8B9IWU4_9PSIT